MLAWHFKIQHISYVLSMIVGLDEFFFFWVAGLDESYTIQVWSQSYIHEKIFIERDKSFNESL